MEETFRTIAAYAALVLESVVILAVCAGAAESIWGMVRQVAGVDGAEGSRRRIWMGFARWLVLALEFALGADIIRTAIAPTWDQIGQLGAIAVIRTGLGFFLEKDIDAFAEPPRPAA